MAEKDDETPRPKPSAKTEYEIIHWNQRRIRFRISRLARDSVYTSNLKVAIESLDFITEVRINSPAQSIAVEYNPNNLNHIDIQEKLIDCIQAAGVVVSAKNLQSIIREAKERGLEFATTHIVGYEVIHRNPCHLRIKIRRLADDSDYSHKLQYLVGCLDFVTGVRINQTASCIAVEFDYRANPTQIQHSQQMLFEVIQQAVYAEIDDQLLLQAFPQEKISSQGINYWERLGPPAVSLVLGLSLLLGAPIPLPLAGGMLLLAAVPIYKRAIRGIQQDSQLTVDFLDGIAIGLHGFHGAFFAPALMVGLIESGEVIRDMTARGSQRESLNLLDCLDKSALVERDGQEIEIPVKDIIVGDRLILYPGDQVPVDGRILEGIGLIDQCKLTGESVPITRTIGDEIFASTLLVDGHLRILAERTGKHTRAGMIVNLMQSAPVHDTRVENYAAAVANQLVVPTLILSGVVGIFTGDVTRAISLLTLDMGTGIRISVPTAILSALTYAARHGVLIRNGRAIEMLAKVDTIVFDKTGTLTQGHAGVTDVYLTQTQISQRELLSLAATAEQGLTHPVADAIVRHTKKEGIALGECTNWEYRVGLGVVATIDGINLLVGSHRLMIAENISLAALASQPYLESGGHSLVYVAGNGELLGVILYSDPLRDESQTVIQGLQQQGMTAYMLSGDVTRVAEAIAHRLSISPDCVYAEAFPERKVEVVRELHDSGKTVAFCGDGINDSAALAYADVSISFAGATDIARETADVVLMENDLRGLILAIQISQQAMAIVNQNIWAVSVPNLLGIAAGTLFPLNPILAILINNGSAVLASFNSLRPLLGPELGFDLSALTGKELPQLSNETNSSLPVVTLNGKGKAQDKNTPIDNLAGVRAFPEPTALIIQPVKRLGVTSQSLS